MVGFSIVLNIGKEIWTIRVTWFHLWIFFVSLVIVATLLSCTILWGYPELRVLLLQRLQYVVSSKDHPIKSVTNHLSNSTFQHLIQQSVQFLRSMRPYSVETPMQFIFIHRCVQHMFRNVGMIVKGMDRDYQKWLRQRAGRMFVDDLNAPVSAFIFKGAKCRSPAIVFFPPRWILTSCVKFAVRLVQTIVVKLLIV